MTVAGASRGPVRVRVLYFAAVRDLVGLGEERVALDPGAATVAGLTAELERLHPALCARLASLRIARNEVFASAGDRLRDGDVLALIPPVAGG
jgi:molybdopterin converting factor subunit 1